MLIVPLIADLDSQHLPEGAKLLENLPAQAIGCLNWEKDYPYRPDVHFQMAHNGRELFVRFSVREKAAMALAPGETAPCTAVRKTSQPSSVTPLWAMLLLPKKHWMRLGN